MQVSTHEPGASLWQRWLHHPENLWLRKCSFYIHLWVSIVAGIYVMVISISGSALVFRNQLEALAGVDAHPNSLSVRALLWLVDLHENLFLGPAGRRFNGIGALCLTVIGLTGAFLWWPGIAHWRQSLAVHRNSGFGRLNWELHNVLGVWCFAFVLMWGVSGFYFAFPEAFDPLARALNLLGAFQNMQLGDLILTWLSNLHFGRFDFAAAGRPQRELFAICQVSIEALWTVLGLAPAALLFTGAFMCCHRWFFKRPYKPDR